MVLKMSLMSKEMSKKDLTQRVLSAVANIPRGHVLTYKEVAIRAGSPGASRAVGTVLSKNYDTQVPCRRVICSDGRIGEYNRGAQSKKQLLKEEGFL